MKLDMDRWWNYTNTGKPDNTIGEKMYQFKCSYMYIYTNSMEQTPEKLTDHQIYMYKISVPTSERKRPVCDPKTTVNMYREIICIFCENFTEHLKLHCLEKMQRTSLLQQVVRIAMVYNMTFRILCRV
jgi:hypothetical protein